TVGRWDIPHEHVEAFLRSMRQDLTVSSYATYDDLRDYMHGSAAVIGLEMVPILEPLDTAAHRHAAALGEAFQLTNFIRDVGEDLRRGRVYLPQEDLRRFGVTRDALAAGVVTEPIRALLRFQIERTRGLYAIAREGIPMLHPTSRDCIATAVTLYGELLEAVERADYQVMTQRVRVPISRRLQVALPGLVRSRAARRSEGAWRLAPTPPLSR
ncbi:MAG TPA: phytoene/squalene synthase family protein, partial [Actinomycetes bacterium]|nr:phytoene/squalene synthase family protein [Actinomycetes bacterium]